MSRELYALPWGEFAVNLYSCRLHFCFQFANGRRNINLTFLRYLLCFFNLFKQIRNRFFKIKVSHSMYLRMQGRMEFGIRKMSLFSESMVICTFAAMLAFPNTKIN